MQDEWDKFQEWLDESMQSSANGTLIARALRKEKTLQMGFNLTLQDIYADEFATMIVLEQERNRFESEKETNG